MHFFFGLFLFYSFIYVSISTYIFNLFRILFVLHSFKSMVFFFISCFCWFPVFGSHTKIEQSKNISKKRCYCLLHSTFFFFVLLWLLLSLFWPDSKTWLTINIHSWKNEVGHCFFKCFFLSCFFLFYLGTYNKELNEMKRL